MRQKGSKEGGGSWFWMLCILRRRRIVLPPPFHVIGKKDVARSEQGNVPNGIHAVGDSTVLPFQYSTGRTTGPERERGEGRSPGQKLVRMERTVLADIG